MFFTIFLILFGKIKKQLLVQAKLYDDAILKNKEKCSNATTKITNNKQKNVTVSLIFRNYYTTIKHYEQSYNQIIYVSTNVK